MPDSRAGLPQWLQEGMNHHRIWWHTGFQRLGLSALTFTNLGAWGNDIASAPSTEVTPVNWIEDKDIIVWHCDQGREGHKSDPAGSAHVDRDPD